MLLPLARACLSRLPLALPLYYRCSPISNGRGRAACSFKRADARGEARTACRNGPFACACRCFGCTPGVQSCENWLNTYPVKSVGSNPTVSNFFFVGIPTYRISVSPTDGDTRPDMGPTVDRKGWIRSFWSGVGSFFLVT